MAQPSSPLRFVLGDDLSELTGVPKNTLANKAKLIRDVLRLAQMEPEFCRQELLAANPMARMISVDGFIVDARAMPVRDPGGGTSTRSDP